MNEFEGVDFPSWVNDGRPWGLDAKMGAAANENWEWTSAPKGAVSILAVRESDAPTNPFSRIAQLEKALGDQVRHNKSLVNRLGKAKKRATRIRNENIKLKARSR